MTLRKLSSLQGTDAARYTLPAEDHRLNHAGLWTPNGGNGIPPLSTRSGFVPGPANPGAVTVAVGGVTINPFQFVLWGTVTSTQGVYEGVSDASEFRAITPASSTQFRRGRLVVRVYDQLNNAAKDDWDIEVIYGPAEATAGAATLPALPANAFQIREFAVSNTGAITVSGIVPWVGSRTGITPLADPDDNTPGAFIGQYRDHPTRGLERWYGSVWGLPSPAGTMLRRQERLSNAGPVNTPARVIVSDMGPGTFVLHVPTRVQFVTHGKMTTGQTNNLGRVWILVTSGETVNTADSSIVGMCDIERNLVDRTFTYECDALLAAGTWTMGLALSSPLNQNVTLLFEANPTPGQRPANSTVLKAIILGNN